jgi:hypothetical protein
MLRHSTSTLAIQVALFVPGVAAFAVGAQTAVDTGELLQRIRTRIVTHLSQLPNYTCHQVVQRLVRRAGSGSLERQDTVELEVAFVARRELFARPGESRFREESFSKLITVGTFGNGLFGSHIDALFSGDAAEFKYVGPCKKDGHKTIRFDFYVPQEKSQFLIRNDSRQGIVAYKGSLWVDAETLDPVRLELQADHIPSHIGVSSVRESMRYALTRIRDSEFLLPRNSEITASDTLGNYTVNLNSLEKCREFTGESVITYDTPRSGVPDKGSASRETPER